MPRNIPPAPNYADPRLGAEKQVWEALQALPDNAVVIAQYVVVDDRRVAREADFLVLVPDVGIGVIEVKGGLVHSYAGEWFSRDSSGVDHIIHEPIAQAQRAGYALRDFLEGQGVPCPAWVPVAVLPRTTLTSGFRTADSRPQQWVDKHGVADLAARVQAAVYIDDAPSADQVADIVEALERRLPKPVAWQVAQEQAAHADILTRDQYAILRAIRTNNRILVTGGPGSGKTWLALEHARQETVRGARVAVICYNRGLALHMVRQAQQWPQDQRPAYVGTLHQLALDWTAKEVPDDADSAFWDALPADLQKAAAAIDEQYRFHLVVVDEAQDFHRSWWLAVRALLEDPDDGPMVVFGDDDQNVYDRDLFELPAFEVALTENVRNTVEIAAVLQRVSDEAVETRGAHGPDPMFLPCEQDAAVDVAQQAARALLSSGQYRPGDIAVLTTHRRHPEHTRLLEELGPVAYAESLQDREAVAYATVKGFKGLERPVVVLAVNGFHEDADPRRVLRVGVSRATHHLVVVGEEQIGLELGMT